MKLLKELLVFIGVTLFFIFAKSFDESGGLNTELRQASEASWQQLDAQELALPETGFGLHILQADVYRSARQINIMLRRTGDVSGNFLYSQSQVGTYTMSAQGLDRRQHLVNTYLEGYQPFPVENVMTPLYVLAQRKRYLLDEKQYAGRVDVWQSSRQAFYYPRGDCEDHAIALADWLIEMGEDARVAVGDVSGNGHAWVVLFKDGKQYLLEATQKRGVSRSRPYPLASLHMEYHPQYMFNREYFWENTGSKFTTRYAGLKWKKQSRYKRQS